MMKSGLVKLLFPVLLSIGLFSQAQSRTIQLGTLNDDTLYAFDVVNSGAAFTQRATFRLNDLAAADDFSFADLAPGAQMFMTSGAWPVVSRNLLGVAAVPETETWLMVVIGAGLVVFQLRRTQRSLQHRPLAA